MTVELDEERGAQVHEIVRQDPDAGGCVMQARSALVFTQALVSVLTDSGPARKGASLLPAVLQWRDDHPCWQEGGGGRRGEFSEYTLVNTNVR